MFGGFLFHPAKITGVPWAYYFVPHTGFIRCTGFGGSAALLGVTWNVKFPLIKITSEKYFDYTRLFGSRLTN